MAHPVSTPHELPATVRAGRCAIGPVAIGVAGLALAGLGVVVLLATLVLWARYGTAVFFEMITAGFAACF